MDGEFNAIIWSNGKALLNQRVCKLYNFTDCTKKYIFYIIQRVLKHIEETTPKTTVKHISIKQILDIDIPLPPIEVQNEIIKELDSYQRIIDGAKEIIDSYTPNIGIKDEWKVFKLGDICKYEGGTQPPKSTFKNSPTEGYIRLLQIRDYKSDENAVYIPMKERHKTCDETDIMIGRY